VTEQNWPEKKCDRCGKPIRLVKTRSGWMAFEISAFKPHKCPYQGDVYHHRDKLVPMFNPRKNRFDA
jgi:hypothetical protein